MDDFDYMIVDTLQNLDNTNVYAFDEDIDG